MNKNSWVKPGNITPKTALSLAKQASSSKEVQKKGVKLMASNLSDASLLYLAAKHFDLTIESIALDGEKAELSPLMLHTQFENWHDFIVQQPEQRKADQRSETRTKRAKRRNTSRAMAELDELIGLEGVKQQVQDVIAFRNVNILRKRKGLPVLEIGQHLVFTGNPGTGKTTVARIVGDVYRDLGLLKSGHFIETDGRGLVGEYIGQTAPKVKEIVMEAMDGVLFIDEAYALTPEEIPNDLGHEAIATLLKMMEDHRDRLVVILAGYEDEMERMLASNPGLKSRFKTKIDFPDYGPDELMAIFKQLCEKQAYVLTKDAAEKATALFAAMHAEREQHFGNGRAVRNAFDRSVMNQASRLASTRRPNKKALQTLIGADIPALSQLSW